MPLGAPIFLAAGEDSIIDVAVWLIAGAIWLFLQVGAAKKKQRQKNAGPGPAPRPAAPAGGAETPSPDELADIFRRLGADIPGTPAPVPRPAPAPAMVRKPVPRAPLRKTAASAVAPALARRLAQAKREAEAAARRAEIERRAEEFAANAAIPVVQSRAGEHRALDVATRHATAILPRIYAMGTRLASWPILPMPGFGPPHQTGVPLRAALHSRREIRDAIVAQVYLQPGKGFSGP